MNSCDAFIKRAMKELPEMCTVKDLLKLGIYRSEQAAAHARRKGLSPDYFKLPHRGVLYPKQGVIEFLKQSQHPRERDENRNLGAACC